MLTPLPGCTPQKPGAASFPFLGMEVSFIIYILFKYT